MSFPAFGRIALCAAAVAVLVSACLPDAHQDYEDFLSKTESYRQSGVVDAGPVDAKPPVDPIKGNYFASCYSDLMAGNLNKMLRFYTETEFVPETSGGKITLKLYPFKVTARSFAKSETTNVPLSFEATPVDATGKFKATSPSIDIAGAANPFSGSDITISPLTLDGRFTATGKDKFCSGFAGKITKPITNDFTAACLFYPLKEGDAFDFPGGTGESLSIPSLSLTLKQDDFVCQ